MAGTQEADEAEDRDTDGLLRRLQAWFGVAD
jgi:hypothetical protein